MLSRNDSATGTWYMHQISFILAHARTHTHNTKQQCQATGCLTLCAERSLSYIQFELFTQRQDQQQQVHLIIPTKLTRFKTQLRSDQGFITLVLTEPFLVERQVSVKVLPATCWNTCITVFA